MAISPLALVLGLASATSLPVTGQQASERPEVGVIYDVSTGQETTFELSAEPRTGGDRVPGWTPLESYVELLGDSWDSDLTSIVSQDFPWSANCRIKFVKGGLARVGSGTLISPRHVITAGHVVHEGSGGNWVTNVEVRPAWDGDSDAYGDANGIRLGSFTKWTVDGLGDGDMGIIELDRPVGFLTGYFGYGWNSLGSFFTTNTFYRAGYPGAGTCYAGAPNTLYFGSGTFDTTTTFQLEADVFWSCITGGMSGAGVYYIDGLLGRIVYGIGRAMGGAAAPFNKWDTRVTQGKFDFLNLTFIPDGFPAFDVDLVPLAVEAQASLSPIGAGEQLDDLQYVVGNMSDYSPASAVTYYVDVYLSTDDDVTTSDTLIGSHSFTYDFAARSSTTVVSGSPPSLPDDLASGQYWVGVDITSADYDGSNNIASGWDAAEITVNARWPHVPTTFAAVGTGLLLDFENAPALNPAIALNALDAHTREDDPDAWCNVGQLAASLYPFSGLENLELGVNPASVPELVSNGLVLALDGGGAIDLELDYVARNFGEEVHDDDGIFLSEDGLDWVPLLSDWSAIGGSWVSTIAVDLTTTYVDTSGPFYLLFAQSDNTAYGVVDGIGIDDVRVHPAAPALSITNLVGGGVATVSLTGGTPGGLGWLFLSVTGGGPTPTPFGAMDLALPIHPLPLFVLDAAGDGGFSAGPLNPGLTGLPVWFQAIDIGSLVWSNPLAMVIG